MNTNGLTMSVKLQAFFLFMVLVLLSLTTIPIARAEVLEAGSWTGKQYKIKGDWTIDTSGPQTVIRFSDTFKTKSGPDLKIFLSKKSINNVTGETATQDSVMLAKLSSSRGAQEYVLPAHIDISDFNSILIHCEAYAVLWGGADIQI